MRLINHSLRLGERGHDIVEVYTLEPDSIILTKPGSLRSTDGPLALLNLDRDDARALINLLELGIDDAERLDDEKKEKEEKS